MAVVLVCGLACYTAWELLRDGTLVGMDTVTAFYPWYAFLGERLRAGHIPLWNPHQFSGTPFAADPESGWAYLPAMVLFTWLPLGAAANAYLLAHLLLAGLGVYALGRTLGMSPIGGVAAAIAYTYSGFFFGHNVCCFAYSSVAAWLPVAVLGAERSIRSSTWRGRALVWGVAGVAVSQILAMWLGQGAYYALLFLGAYVAYRTLLASAASPRQRIAALVVHGSAVLIVGVGLGAMALLPRLEFNALSNLPGGYPAPNSPIRTVGPMDWGIIEDWQSRLLAPGFHYVGWVTLALAIMAPLLARRRAAVPFFASISVLVLIAARFEPTPLHALLGLLPAFEQTHAHAPERALLVFFLGPALLAGASVSRLQVRHTWPWALVSGVVVLLVLVDLRIAWRTQLAESLVAGGAYELKPIDLARYYAPTGAGRFLQSVDDPSGFRYVGYAGHIFGGPIAYTLGWSDPTTVALEVNNRGLMSGLHDIQGYNPLHIERYDRFVRAMNGRDQEYHQVNVFEHGLSSPLLDLLGGRYIIVPRRPAADETLPRLERPLATVYQDFDVRVLENRAALPRAWIVHSALRTGVEEALELIASGAVDPRQTALLEQPPPPLAQGSSEDQARVVSYDADRIQLETSTTAPGLLVLSEVFYPAWKAYVDGVPGQVYVADGMLRAVPLPEGVHRVDLRFESPALVGGLVISAGMVVALVLIGTTADRRRACT